VISLTTMSFAIALFGALSVLGDRLQRAVAWGLALFLGIAAFDSLIALVEVWELSPPESWICGLELLATILYGPAIYLYVLTITGTVPSGRQIALCLGVTMALGLGLLAAFLTLPPQTRIDLQLGTPIVDERLALHARIVAGVMQLSFLLVTCGFLVACWRVLDDNVQRLSALYSTIEDRSLAWLRGVMILIVVASGWVALQGLVEQVTPTDGWFGAVDALITLTLVGLLAHFGVRQRPALLTVDLPDTPPQETSEKYARSALDPARMQKLASRMAYLMRSQSLHRDPGLSLRGLADKVGSSPNYVSQTLNDHLGVSFFDFVNGFRVDEAASLLRQTDRSVTDIALDVGFNSRSTFNAAVRKHRGLSPTEMRRGSTLVRAVPTGQGDVRA
jgi:AraC-like DNA-binding protein